MSKIIINSKIKSSDGTEVIKEKPAILKDGKISYNHNNINHVIEAFDDAVIISRSNNDFDIILEFDKKSKKTGKYILKDVSIKMDIETITKSLLMHDNGFEIEYEVYINGTKSDDFVYEIEWREL